MKKANTIILIFSLLLSLLIGQTAFAYHDDYPIYPLTTNQLKNRTYDVWVYNNSTGNFAYSTMSGTDTLAYGLYVWEHASFNEGSGSRYNTTDATLYDTIVITTTDYLTAWENMRKDKGSIIVLSGLRNVHHNWNVGGAAQYSQHQAGSASDPQVPSGQEQQWVDDAYNKWGFDYAYAKDGAIHVDTREQAGFPTLYPDDTSNYVWVAETGIHLHGYDNIYRSGYYSPSIDQPDVKQFQLDHNLTDDGVIGSNTWDKITTEDSHTP